MYGYVETTTQGNPNAPKFGLNTKAKLVKFEHNPNGGAGGAQQDCLDIEVVVMGRSFKRRYFAITKVYKDNVELTDTNSDEYKEALTKEFNTFNKTMIGYLKTFVDEETIKTALAAPLNSFGDYAKVLERLIKSVPNWDKQDVDIFLQYQFKPTGSNTRTFLELPKTSKQGEFITKTPVLGTFKSDSTAGLQYIDENGVSHLFKRSQWFMDSNMANPVILSDQEEAAQDMNSSADTGTNW